MTRPVDAMDKRKNLASCLTATVTEVAPSVDEPGWWPISARGRKGGINGINSGKPG